MCIPRRTRIQMLGRGEKAETLRREQKERAISRWLRDVKYRQRQERRVGEEGSRTNTVAETPASE